MSGNVEDKGLWNLCFVFPIKIWRFIGENSSVHFVSWLTLIAFFKKIFALQRYEDQDLNLHPLPAPRLVAMPENLPNELFGDIAMVTEFVSSYSGLLMPDAEYPIYTGQHIFCCCCFGRWE